MRSLRALLAVLALLLITGCDDDSNDGGLQTGSLTGIPIEGLRYHTSPGNIGGVTGQGGSFNFLPHDQVTFSLGDIRVGEVRARQRITLKTMEREMRGRGERRVASDLTLLRLLLSLDRDDVAANGISLAPETHAALTRSALGDTQFTEIQDVIYRGDMQALDESRALRETLATASIGGLAPFDVVLREYGAVKAPGVYSADSSTWRDTLESAPILAVEALTADGHWFEYAFADHGLNQHCGEDGVRCASSTGSWSYDRKLEAVVYDAVGLWSNVTTMYDNYLPAPTNSSGDMLCGLNIDFDGGWREVGRNRDLWLCIRGGSYVSANLDVDPTQPDGVVVEDNFSVGLISWDCRKHECQGGLFFNWVTSPVTTHFPRGNVIRAVLLPGLLWEQDRLKIIANGKVTVYERAYY